MSLKKRKRSLEERRDYRRDNRFESKIEKIMNLLDFGAKLGHLFRNPS